jgi:hypothetical protein
MDLGKVADGESGATGSAGRGEVKEAGDGADPGPGPDTGGVETSGTAVEFCFLDACSTRAAARAGSFRFLSMRMKKMDGDGDRCKLLTLARLSHLGNLDQGIRGGIIRQTDALRRKGSNCC